MLLGFGCQGLGVRQLGCYCKLCSQLTRDLCKPLIPPSSIHILQENVISNICFKWVRKSKKKEIQKLDKAKILSLMYSDGFSFLLFDSACILFGRVEGSNHWKKSFSNPYSKSNIGVSKNSLTIFPKCQHYSFLIYLQFRTESVIQLDFSPLSSFYLCLSVCAFVCGKEAVHGRDGNKCGKEVEGTHYQHARYFQGRVYSKTKKSGGQYSISFC